ncbi:MAG: Chromate resistance protein ChrB, partial [Thermomicrobiales bacterium]
MGTPAATTDNTPDIAEHSLPATWALLIYVLPSHPSRLRAAVWRDVKRAGAVYLRDGACALPERP